MKTDSLAHLEGLADGAAVVRAAWLRALEPPPDELVWQWADANRKLSTKASAEQGDYRTARFPFTREIMEALSPSSPVDTVVCVKAAQMGISEVAYNLIGYGVHRAPCSIAMVLPTLDLARDTKKTRIDPMVELSRPLRARIRDPRATRDAGNTSLMMEFDGGGLRLCGANSAAGLRGWTAKWLIFDDYDAFPPSAGEEGDPGMLADRATLSYQGRRKKLEISTPTFDGRSRICASWEESDQSFFHVECPRCGDRSPIAFSRATNFVVGARKFVVFNDGAKRDDELDAHLKCEACGGRIEDYEREAMIAGGVWIAELPERSARVRGFHISRLYAPAGMGTLTDLVREFRKARKGGDETLRAFMNRDLGEPWREKGERPEWKRIYEKREPYKIGTVPRGGLVLTGMVDVQGDRLELEVKAWGEGLENWSVDYRVFLGSPSEPATWDQIERALQTTYPHEDGAMLSIRMLGIDTGFATQDCYAWIRRQSRARVVALKGDSDRLSAIVSQPQKVEVNAAGRRLKRGLLVWHVGGGVAKSELYGKLRMEKPLEGEPFPPGYCHFPEFGAEHFMQLTAEELRPINVKGYRKYVWVKVHERNEVLDCHVGNRAVAAILGLDRWSSDHWTAAREAIGSVATSPRPTTPAPRGSRSAPPPEPPAPRGWLGGGGGSPGWFGR